MTKIFEEILNKVRNDKPLVHHLTNYITANDSANIVLAVGGSPLMADSIDEIEEIIPKVKSLVVNLGTLNKQRAEVIINACAIAHKNNIPVILDPVGVTGTNLRQQTAKAILDKVTVIKGNLSEIRSLSGLKSKQVGVDVYPHEQLAVEEVKELSKRLNCVVAVTGETDAIAYIDSIVKVENGSIFLTKITGAGCMISSLIGTYCAVTNDYFAATTLGITAMALAGERAHSSGEQLGIGSFKVNLFDNISKFDALMFKEAKISYE